MISDPEQTEDDRPAASRVEEPPLRKIIHIDMDAFFASVEQRDHPELRGKPVAVGGSSRRGVVAAASYEARVFGVRSAMPSVTAARRCPDLIFVKGRFDVYRAVSHQIRGIFARFTDIVEPLSLDEAYLDVTHNHPGIILATEIAQAIREAIQAETGLTASAGVSYNKFLAKLASDENKPDGLCVVPPSRGPAFVAALPVKRFHGVGPVTARRMQALGIETGADLRARDLGFLEHHFGKSAAYYYWAARGRDDRPVRASRQRKSVGTESTFSYDLLSEDALIERLDGIAADCWKRIARSGSRGRTVTLKIKFADFSQITRAQSLGRPLADAEELAAIGRTLLRAQLPQRLGIRLLGLTLSNLEEGGASDAVRTEQLALAI